MNLWSAPFKTPLKILGMDSLSTDVRLILIQLGLDHDEVIQKLHAAPLGDPVSLKIGNQVFTLRSEVCKKIDVECT